MGVMRGVESHWEDLSDKLFVRHSEKEKIPHLYQSDHQKMEAIIKHYVRHKPSRSWKQVADALKEMNLPQLAEVVTTKYVRGMCQGWPLASGGHLQMCWTWFMCMCTMSWSAYDYVPTSTASYIILVRKALFLG